MASSASTGEQKYFTEKAKGVEVKKEECKRNNRKLTGAVKLNWWKTELFGNVSVLYHQSFIHLKGERTHCCSSNRSKDLKLDLCDKQHLTDRIIWSLMAALTDLPLIHSVARELEAMAEPQPKVLNRASTIFPWSST